MMGVYIKGMEMPTSCYLCPCNKDDGFGFFTCGITHCDCDFRVRPATCPLVPVPPHGDLIDRYDLKNKEITIDYDEWDDCFDDGLLFVADLIDKAPTVIPADPTKGEK